MDSPAEDTKRKRRETPKKKRRTPEKTPDNRKRRGSSDSHHRHHQQETTQSERVLYKVGSWAKRIALIGYVHRALNAVTLLQAMGLYAAATALSVSRILHDRHSPRGSRRYVMNLAGDDEIVKTMRSQKGYVGWKRVKEIFCPGQSWFSRAFRAATWTVYRNRSTLAVFWMYSIVLRLLRRKSGQSFRRTIFPAGVGGFLRDCARTSGLLFTFPFIFWTLCGISETFIRYPRQGFSKTNAIVLITAASVLSLPIETRKRWKALSAFMIMSVVD